MVTMSCTDMDCAERAEWSDRVTFKTDVLTRDQRQGNRFCKIRYIRYYSAKIRPTSENPNAHMAPAFLRISRKLLSALLVLPVIEIEKQFSEWLAA